ncbi:Mitochondrial copper homeostasis protein [Coniothyrium glycines]
MSEKSPSTPPKTEEWAGSKASKFDNKAHSEYFDPCQEAADKSIRCLKRNGGERAMCSDFFQAYRDCKQQWQEARKEARKSKSWFG